MLGIVGDWGAGYYEERVTCPVPAKRVMEQITDRGADRRRSIICCTSATSIMPAPTGGQCTTRKRKISTISGRTRAPGGTSRSTRTMKCTVPRSGYFLVSLKAEGNFDAQNGMSYFAMTYGPWLVLGLDSAYYSDAHERPPNVHGRRDRHRRPRSANPLAAAVPGPPGPDHGDDPSHRLRRHRQQCDAALPAGRHGAGAAPTLWYWGHVHNGIVYEQIDQSGSIPTRGRCCGHAAIPFGNAWGLQDHAAATRSPNILYYAHTPDPALPAPAAPPGQSAGPERLCLGHAAPRRRLHRGLLRNRDRRPSIKRLWTAAELDPPVPTEPP